MAYEGQGEDGSWGLSLGELARAAPIKGYGLVAGAAAPPGRTSGNFHFIETPCVEHGKSDSDRDCASLHHIPGKRSRPVVAKSFLEPLVPAAQHWQVGE